MHQNISFADCKLLHNQFAGDIKFVPNALPEIESWPLGLRLDRSAPGLCLVLKHLSEQSDPFDQMSHRGVQTIRNLIRILFSREVGRVLTGTPFRSGAGASIGKACSLRRQ